MKNVFLLTGEPNIGKTTALKKVVDLIGKEKCGGFYTEEIKENGRRIGFKLKTIDGQEGMIADISYQSELRIGKYGLKLDVLDTIVINSIYRAIEDKKIIIIDEIGPMQVYSEKFKKVVIDAINSSNLVLGTIVYRKYEWIDELKKDDRITLVEVSNENRNFIYNDMFNMITNIEEYRSNYGKFRDAKKD